MFFFGGGVQDDTEAQGSSGSQEKESSEEKMETSTEVFLQLINLKFSKNYYNATGGWNTSVNFNNKDYYLSDLVLSL